MKGNAMVRSTIICLHGLGASSESFRSLERSSLSLAHDILAPDFAGFGSRAAERCGSQPLRHAADEIAGLVRTYDLDRVILIGHSMGGAVALLVAAAVPERIGGVVSIEGNLIAEDCGLISRKLAAAGAEGSASVKAQLIETAGKASRTSLRAWADAVARVAPEALCCYASELVELSDGQMLLDAFNASRCRKLYLHGDGYIDHPVLQRLSGVPVRHVAGTGHFVMQDDPEATARAILDELPGV